MTRLLSDDDVRARLTPQLALEGARRALVEAHRGGLHAPPRVQAELGAARTGALGAAAYGAPFFTSRELTHLGAALAGDAAGRGGDADITLYASTGLAGSEVVIARRLLEAS